MKRFVLLLFTVFLYMTAFAQLEVKEGSFHKVDGFVNINLDKMTDDNDKPYAVLKIKTENIGSKERRELNFGGDARTFFEAEYKDGEVWLYISYYASFIKISHEELSSTEFYFPFDMEPKCGYEMTLVNKANAVISGWAALTVTTKPENGAKVLLNGRDVNATTPYTNNMITPGKYEITVSKYGFKTTTKNVEIHDGDNLDLEIEMSYDRETIQVQTFTVNGVSFDMVLVKGGTFTMGSVEIGESDSKPTHQVTVSDFMIGKFEVTQKLWVAVMGKNPSRFIGDNLPVECVSWKDCQKFIKKLNKLTGQNFRLPTEAEWEYAARGGTTTTLYNNNDTYYLNYNYDPNLDKIAWYPGNCGQNFTTSAGCDVSNGYDITEWSGKQYNDDIGGTHPVGLKEPNAYGLYDMIGNVFEWCQDWYGSYSRSGQTDPEGPSKGADRVARGGSWYLFSGFCSVSRRMYSNPDSRSSNFGFRLAIK